MNTAIQNKLINHITSLGEHPVFENNYFKFLSRHGFTKELYDIHRANFLFRTMSTVIGIANICAHAAQQHDKETLVLFSYILNEECGNGVNSKCHEILMEQSHNIFGNEEYELAPLFVKDLVDINECGRTGLDNMVVDETKRYRTEIGQLLNKSYPTMLGIAYALELHAGIMLTVFRQAFSISRCKMELNEYKKKVEIYFNCHLDNGVQDRHAHDAKQCILSNCKSWDAYNDIVCGIESTLILQNDMWSGMYNRVQKI
jgi:hypothetical protein